MTQSVHICKCILDCFRGIFPYLLHIDQVRKISSCKAHHSSCFLPSEMSSCQGEQSQNCPGTIQPYLFQSFLLCCLNCNFSLDKILCLLNKLQMSNVQLQYHPLFLNSDCDDTRQNNKYQNEDPSIQGFHLP